ncbi:Cytosolic sulfotransferase 6 [Camellia lanceoleosa]|uniref:Cytosolic sulfotransferase 6 n=1 Tax=Camellia lanceoleosa TaxID=1840588 RepID=A0ACC0J034_9ERIC|nr:Cytosolic sulfotransferase 6 [Camellia lanceoleosa]
MATSARGSDEETSFLDDSPKVEWWPGTTLVHWKGFWLMPDTIKSVVIIENQFKPLPSDILLLTLKLGRCSGRSFLRPCVRVLEREREKNNVFFVTYEELKENPKESVRSLAEFLGCSLTPDEIEQVVWKSSHERLSKLDVNTDEVKGLWPGLPFKLYFRKGVVGDGKNQLTTEMMERLEALESQRYPDEKDGGNAPQVSVASATEDEDDTEFHDASDDRKD